MYPLFPSLSTFLALCQQEAIYQDPTGIFRKHADLNRYTIATAQGPLALTAAVASPTWQVPYGQIRLFYGEKWPEKHIKTLRSAYSAAPYFAHYQEAVSQILLNKYDFLYQLAHASLSFCLNTAGCLQTLEIIDIEAPPGFEKQSFWPILTPETLARHPILPPTGYRAVFGADFDSKLSILDTLFSVGPHRLQLYVSSYVSAIRQSHLKL